MVAGRLPGQGGRRGRVGGCNNLYDTPLSCFSNRNITIYGGGGVTPVTLECTDKCEISSLQDMKLLTFFGN